MAKQGARAVVPKLRFSEFRRDAWNFISGSELFAPISNREAEDGLPILAITQEHGAIPRDLIDYHVSVTEKSIESYKVVERGDFIISLRSFQGGIEYSNYRGICSPAYVILRRKGKGADQYFKQFFKSDRFIQQINRNIEGLRDGKMISFKQFSEQLISAPSLKEQRKIADFLISLDELIAAQERKLGVLKACKRGLVRQIFPREGETRPSLRFPEFRDAPEWLCNELGDICTISSGATPLRSNYEFYEGGTIPWIKTTDLNNSFIDSTQECVTSKAKLTINPVGSVVVAMYGGFNQIGRTGLLRIPAATNQALSVLRVRNDATSPVYLLTWLNAKVENWKRIASSSRKDPNITSNDVARFPVCVPSLAEQQRIADCLSTLDTQIAAESELLAALRTHKQGLVQQLFPAPGAG